MSSPLIPDDEVPPSVSSELEVYLELLRGAKKKAKKSEEEKRRVEEEKRRVEEENRAGNKEEKGGKVKQKKSVKRPEPYKKVYNTRAQAKRQTGKDRK
ncbi:hypothetical protein DFH05DRAFT_1519647 [Lentinula detonsa]|uniref:Uncharacterized protein n=1 Tax=Lentinula detonsa TaxID=2804962 RepID=A0A9W8PCV6_9AGAR|nr:hypothetical protein DFH05DRAFT_1519647 [Lentinula detonsa]KAJ3979346.1 hypothetical protein F5890DRAFT_1558843 [Lentinula detonsa]